jgi:hypothetical protein
MHWYEEFYNIFAGYEHCHTCIAIPLSAPFFLIAVKL